MTADQPKRKSRTVAVVLAVVILAAVGGAVWWLERTGPPPEREFVLTQEATDYLPNLQLEGTTIQAHENALGQMLVEIEGNITNAGDRPLEEVVLSCIFYDINGMEITREPVAIVRARDGVLGPGQTRPFRLPFDSIPEGWNQMSPTMAIAEITFA